MDEFFMELMLKQQERGNKLGNTFTRQAWTDMLALFNAKFGSGYNKRVLRHRYRKLCKYYSDLMALTNQKGFCWDENREMVVADDDVWEAYIKVHLSSSAANCVCLLIIGLHDECRPIHMLDYIEAKPSQAIIIWH